MARLLFSKQDSLGTKSWNGYASEAGIQDTIQFSACMADPLTVQAIDASVSAGQQMGVHATPTVVVNGWILVGAPPSDSLEAVIDRLKKKKIPRK